MPDSPLMSTRILYAVVRDEHGQQATPTAMVLRLKDPSGREAVPPVEPALMADLPLVEAALGESLEGVVGVFKAEWVPDVVGTWDAHWQATGPTKSWWSFFQVPWPKGFPELLGGG